MDRLSDKLVKTARDLKKPTRRELQIGFALSIKDNVYGVKVYAQLEKILDKHIPDQIYGWPDKFEPFLNKMKQKDLDKLTEDLEKFIKIPLEKYYPRWFKDDSKRESKIAKNIISSEVAREILSQLGGNKFLMMTGAKNLSAHSNSLSFRLPGNGFSKYNYVKIELNSMDTYDIELGNIRGSAYKKQKEFNDIYNDQLVELLEENTGLRFSLGSMRSSSKNETLDGYIAYGSGVGGGKKRYFLDTLDFNEYSCDKNAKRIQDEHGVMQDGYEVKHVKITIKEI